ncbi:hypothetical protein Vretifemale_19886 [Volvox reticuliferus]|uniref:Glycoside-hydrolase family GH114 TIM-barrel domain-containing protein n=1 Tax=Volvox reticuliferus TaxID=1737510 RepID=A0A8J4D2G2_9CHLO|nr:hypothetical protein Vretifemale_19886 [Volvox reticuliferus]
MVLFRCKGARFSVVTRLLAVAVLTAGWCYQGSGAAQTCPREPPGMGVLIPWYIGPWDTAAYNKLASYGPRCGIYAIVVGDSSGPPTHDFPLYTTGFSTLYNSGIQLYGYVHTMSNVAAHQARPQADVIAEINSWFDNFGSLLLGIFFDEVDGATVNVDPSTYYGALAMAVHNRSAQAFVVFNPGSKISCSLAQLSDIYVRFESYASVWATEYAAGATCDCPRVSSCALLIHGQSAVVSPPGDIRTNLTQLVNQAAGRKFSYMYVTNDVMPNPWDTLASYFGTFMDIVAPPKPPPPAPKPPPSPPPSPPPPRPSPAPPPRSPSPKPPALKPSPPPSPKPSLPKPPPFQPPSTKTSPPKSASPSPPPSPPPSSSGVWRPSGALRWQWQLSGGDFRAMLQTKPQVIDVDVDMASTLLAQAAEIGINRSTFKLICYFSVGTFEPFRVEADKKRGISWAALEQQLGGSAVPGPLYLSYMEPPFSEELWFAIDRADTRSLLVSQVMITRMRSAVAAGCDGIEMDNVDTYDNVPVTAGTRGVTQAQQLSYNAALLDAAHGLRLSAGLKNALDLLGKNFADGRAVATEYDWFLNERCWEFDECSMYGTNIKWDAAVFGVEYCDARQAFGAGARNLRPECVCPLTYGPTPGGGAAGSRPTLNWLIKNVALNAVGLDCREYCTRPGVNCTAPAGGNVNLCVRNTPNNLCPLYNVTAA